MSNMKEKDEDHSRMQRDNSPKDYQSVGRSMLRVDGYEKVVGEARFVADLKFPDCYHVKIFRSECGHGRIRRLDVSGAEKTPGVRKVITGESNDVMIGDCLADQPPLARGKVRFVGEPVAAVVAESIESAEEGVRMIRAEYEEMGVVLTPRESLEKDASLIHEKLDEYEHVGSLHPQPGTNICHYYKVRKGDTESIFNHPDVITAENEFEFPHLSQAALEPHGAVALWTKADDLSIWSSCQSPHLVREHVAHILKMPIARVRVISPLIGGGFGGKSDFTIEPLIALIAREVKGHPVRLILTREEVFVGSLIARGCQCKVKTAVSASGELLAQQIQFLINCGAYGNCSVNIVEGGGHNATGPYEVPNVKIDAMGLYTNTPPVGAYRGYGHPEVHWMIERHMDILADKLDMSPVELRLKNCFRPGSLTAFNQEVKEDHGDLQQCIRLVEERLNDYLENEPPPAEGVYRGAGLASFGKSPVMAVNASSAAFIRFNHDGSVDLAFAGTELGQGSLTALTQIAAEALEVPAESIRVLRSKDTDATPYEWQTVGSTTTWKVGNAIITAAEKAKRRLKKHAAIVFGVHDTNKVRYERGVFSLADDPSITLKISDIAMGYVFPNGRAIGGPIMASGYFTPEGLTFPDEKTGFGNLAAEWTFGCQGAVLDIDSQTGEITLRRLITAIDAGQIINPMLARGQIVGAMVQGLGGALTERIVYREDGKMRTDSFVDYKVLGPEDMPDKFEVHFVNTPTKDTPFGCRPLAEHAIVSVAPAVANAVKNACGAEFFNLPIIPQDILKALKDKRA